MSEPVNLMRQVMIALAFGLIQFPLGAWRFVRSQREFGKDERAWPSYQ